MKFGSTLLCFLSLVIVVEAGPAEDAVARILSDIGKEVTKGKRSVDDDNYRNYVAHFLTVFVPQFENNYPQSDFGSVISKVCQDVFNENPDDIVKYTGCILAMEQPVLRERWNDALAHMIHAYLLHIGAQVLLQPSHTTGNQRPAAGPMILKMCSDFVPQLDQKSRDISQQLTLDEHLIHAACGHLVGGSATGPPPPIRLSRLLM